MKLNQLASECDEGPCPTVWAVEGTGNVSVRNFMSPSKLSKIENEVLTPSLLDVEHILT
ncbi:hypothetical protein AB0A77_10780 [Streptomyces varsoviensis]|uniref:hypothetical protein n=1 Tax=Streptomyces varsoviensis TaxID=67373 RepID=UPI00340F8F60